MQDKKDRVLCSRGFCIPGLYVSLEVVSDLKTQPTHTLSTQRTYKEPGSGIWVCDGDFLADK